MNRLASSFVALSVVALAGCAGMSSMSSDTGWTTLLDGPKGERDSQY
ncbi:MAG TPA: hypothetical protein VLU54_04530 [Casimicrobiaceae bacterium]|nr:hypothetical protein [Casimicrobiaceae bacterium]